MHWWCHSTEAVTFYDYDYDFWVQSALCRPPGETTQSGSQLNPSKFIELKITSHLENQGTLATPYSSLIRKTLSNLISPSHSIKQFTIFQSHLITSACTRNLRGEGEFQVFDLKIRLSINWVHSFYFESSLFKTPKYTILNNTDKHFHK